MSMADYYSLLSRAVQGLDQSTSDARRALYDRVRTVMMEQLHSHQPTLSDLVKQQLALEEAIKKVESEEEHKERSLVPGRPPSRLALMARCSTVALRGSLRSHLRVTVEP